MRTAVLADNVSISGSRTIMVFGELSDTQTHFGLTNNFSLCFTGVILRRGRAHVKNF
jgi:hypothetical protein